METIWQRLKQRLNSWLVLVPPDKVTRIVKALTPVVRQDPPEYPNTLTDYPNDDVVQRPRVFEPSLCHTRNAFRQGEPVFRDTDIAHRWHTAQRTVMDELLRLISGSPWKNHLVLRGSLLLKSWLPEFAREPGDLDWVVTPSSISFTSSWAKDLFADLTRRILALELIDDIRLLVDQIQCDDIWSYERAPGRRILVPWEVPGLPPGFVQMDVVFGELLPEEPHVEAVTHFNGSSSLLNVVSKELSLVWKLIWLITDMHPQGKDLYDAVLLAEEVALPFELYKNTLLKAEPWRLSQASTLMPMQELDPDWDNFLAEYPWVVGSKNEWLTRLVRAIAPSFPVSAE